MTKEFPEKIYTAFTKQGDHILSPGIAKNKPYSAYLKLRFEIFKRDNFTCQYCGRKAPNIEIVIDHIESVNKGGKTEKSNLITCCIECNLGKSDILLSEHQIPQVIKGNKEMTLPPLSTGSVNPQNNVYVPPLHSASKRGKPK